MANSLATVSPPLDPVLLGALALIHDSLKEVDCIRQLAQRLGEGAASSEGDARDAAAIRRLALHMAGRMRAFLDDPYETAGERTAAHTLGDVVESALGRISLVHPTTLVLVELADEVAAAPAPDVVGELLVPLLDNAATHGASREPIWVRAELDAERLRLAVADAGPGMGEAALRTCHHLGYTTARQRGHRGIGLAAVSALARELGGALRIDSRIGQGTTTTLELPWARGTGTGGA